jgi:hypothetical protein
VAAETGKTRSEVVKESRKRGILTGTAVVATGVATATVGFLPLGVLGLGASSVLAYRWIKHRMDNGIKF